MRETALPLARGSTVQATMDFIRRSHGDAALESILATLGEERRSLLLAADKTGYVPYDLLLALWQAADGRLATAQPDWMEQAGAFAISSLGQELYGGLLRKTSPLEFVTQSVSVYKLYYSQGDMELVQVEPGRAVIRLVGFDTLGPLFCRRQTGGLRSAAELAGGVEVRVKHVRCAFEGDAFCEWEVRWRS
jgi:hypothetical protein